MEELIDIKTLRQWVVRGIQMKAIYFLIVSKDFNEDYYPVFIYNEDKKIETIEKNNKDYKRVQTSINIKEKAKELCIDYDYISKPILSSNFPEQMEYELQSNEYKGKWTEWHPTKEEWLWEMQHHIYKLMHSIKNEEKVDIREFSADVANLAEKSYTEFGI
jgi:hypothetical protein